jgi:hypothetical protein
VVGLFIFLENSGQLLKMPSLRAKRGNPGLWNQSVGDCFVTLFLAMTGLPEEFRGSLNNFVRGLMPDAS